MCFNPHRNIPQKFLWAQQSVRARLEKEMENLFDEKHEWDEGMYLAFNKYIQQQWRCVSNPDLVKSTNEYIQEIDDFWWNRWKRCCDERARANGWDWRDGDGWFNSCNNTYFKGCFDVIEGVAKIDLHLRSMEQNGTRKYFKRCWKFWGGKLPYTKDEDENGMFAAIGLEFVIHKGRNQRNQIQVLTRTKDGRQYDMGIDPQTDCCYFLTPYDKTYGKEAWNHIWMTQLNHMTKHGIISGIQRYDKMFGTDYAVNLHHISSFALD